MEAASSPLVFLSLFKRYGPHVKGRKQNSRIKGQGFPTPWERGSWGVGLALPAPVLGAGGPWVRSPGMRMAFPSHCQGEKSSEAFFWVGNCWITEGRRDGACSALMDSIKLGNSSLKLIVSESFYANQGRQ